MSHKGSARVMSCSSRSVSIGKWRASRRPIHRTHCIAVPLVSTLATDPSRLESNGNPVGISKRRKRLDALRPGMGKGRDPGWYLRISDTCSDLGKPSRIFFVLWRCGTRWWCLQHKCTSYQDVCNVKVRSLLRKQQSEHFISGRICCNSLSKSLIKLELSD